MMTPYQYLNLENQWPAFRLDGLVNNDGTLQLAPLPGQAKMIGQPLAELPNLEGPAGIGVDEQGNLYVAEPAKHRIMRIDACDGATMALPCLRGRGSDPGQLNGPRGVLAGPRNALYVADSGNHRVQVVDLPTLQVRAIWGQPDPYAPPQADDAPGRFDRAWDLAADAAGHIYVVDYGNRRVQKFDAAGRVMPGFWETMAAEPTVPQEPAAITTTLFDGEERLLVVGRTDNRLLVYDTAGAFDEAATELWRDVQMRTTQPLDVAAGADYIYVADAGERVLVFDYDGVFLGVAAGGRGPVAGLALDCAGRLLVNPGGGATVISLQPETAYAEFGTFLAGPITAAGAETIWRRIEVEAEPLPLATHVQFFTYSSQLMDGQGANVPSLPEGTGNAASMSATPLDAWRAAPGDALDFMAEHAPGRYLWLACVVQGDGRATPSLLQIRVTYDHESWTRHLPAVYSKPPANGAFLERALLLFESLLADEAEHIDDLARLFDPRSAPDEGAPNSWLDWLAGWLAFELDERWPPEQRREALAEAFSLYGRRGTVQSLRRLIRLYTGATAHIEEPGRQASLWSLGHMSTLGHDTMLAPAEAQGAVVGTTATLTASHLITDEEYGAPLFEDVAHRFCVQIYAADGNRKLLGDETVLQRVTQVVEREKPAHTTWHLCPIGATMRVGFQARLGIDTIIGGTAPELVVSSPQRLGFETTLAENETTDGLHAMGRGVRLGRQTTLG